MKGVLCHGSELDWNLSTVPQNHLGDRIYYQAFSVDLNMLNVAPIDIAHDVMSGECKIGLGREVNKKRVTIEVDTLTIDLSGSVDGPIGEVLGHKCPHIRWNVRYDYKETRR